MKFSISAFIFVLAIGIGKCETSHPSIFLMTNESIIGIDPTETPKETFRHEITRNPQIEFMPFWYVSFKAASSNSEELRAVDANKIVSFNLSDINNIKQNVMFNSSTYRRMYRPDEKFTLERNFITGMTVDPITSSIYFTTSSLISVMNSGGKFRTLIEFDENDEPVNATSDICLISSESRLYWLSNRTNLYSAFTDGSDIKKLNVNLLRNDFTKMVADENKKVLYLLSKSDQITVVNTTNMEIKTYERAIRSIAVDSKTGDVFVTEFDTIKEKLFLKKFDPFNALGESSLSISLKINPTNHSLLVHRNDENWTECKDCDGICLRKRDNTTICECPQDLIRDQESGKCNTPEKRLFYLSKNSRIISLSWPDNTTKHSINIAGNAIEFEHFAVDYTRNFIYGTTLENAVWKFSPNGTFIIKTFDDTSFFISSLDVDTVSGNIVVITEADEVKHIYGTTDRILEHLCTIKMYAPFLTHDWNTHDRGDRPLLFFQQHVSRIGKIEIDEIIGKMFYSSEQGIYSVNTNGKNIKLVLSGKDIIFSLDKKNRKIFYKEGNGDNIECVDYDGNNSYVVLSLKNVISLKFTNEELYLLDREKKLHRVTHHADQYVREDEISLSYLSPNESTIGIMDVSQEKPTTECSNKNGGCGYFCIISDGKKQCLCKSHYRSIHGKCEPHSQFLVFLKRNYTTLFNPDKDSFQPFGESIVAACHPIPLSITYDSQTNNFYYSDKDGIFSMPYRFTWVDPQCTPVVKTDGLVTGLTMDVPNQDLYFIHDKYKIMKVNLLTRDRTLTIVYESKNKEDVFSHLQYEKCTRSLYFSNNNQDGSSIESFKIDKSDHSKIVEQLDFVYGMAVDREAGKIYYSHKRRKQITRCYYNGKYSKDLMDVKNNQSDYGDIAVLNNDLIYLHNGSEFVAVHKNNTNEMRTIIKTGNNLTFLTTYEIDQDVCPDDPCYNDVLQCSDLCEPIGSREAVCACHPPKILGEDGKTCGFPRCSQVCENRSFCASINETNMECSCLPGYYGERCNQKIGELKDCFNGGVVDHENDCLCPKGFGGSQCEHLIAKTCASIDCLNGGKCPDAPPFSPRCNCTDGFYGDNCAYHDCDNYCKNNGTCFARLKHELPYCDCHVNMYGRRCGEIFQINSSPYKTWIIWISVIVGVAAFVAFIFFMVHKNGRLQANWQHRNRRLQENGEQNVEQMEMHEPLVVE